MGEAITGTPRFEMRGIRKAFGATLAVDGVDLSVAPGEVCAIVGQNGAGKSTLMAILSGALQPDAGHMTLDGAPYRPAHPLDARRAGVAMIYQELSLAPHLTVAENILLGMEPARFGLDPACRDAANSDRRAREARPSRNLDRRGGRDALPCRPTAGRDRPRSRRRLPRARARRANEQPVASRHAAAVCAHRRVEAHGPRDRLHLAFHRGSEGSRRPHRRVARRQGGGRRKQRRSRAHRHRAADGRPAGRRALSPIAAPAGRRHSRASPPSAHRARRSRCTAARSWGLPGCSAPAGHGSFADSSASKPCAPGACASAPGRARPLPTSDGVRACGFLSEDRKEEGLAAALSIADNLTLSRLEGLGPGPMVLPARAGSRGVAMDGAPGDQVAQPATGCRRAVGRQPAEGGARATAPPRRRRPPPRRADARHRRRQQGADLRAHRRARFFERGRGDSSADAESRHGAEDRAPC